MLRYLLETCRTVDEAVERLRTIPVAIPQNVTLVDPDRTATVYVGPDIPLTGAPDSCAANHQHLPVPDGQERFSRTRRRLAAVRAAGSTSPRCCGRRCTSARTTSGWAPCTRPTTVPPRAV
ncbi:carcinine hydrolase/isopenicillin-N N-acyltransferase family protein [Streptomyces sp. NPDC093586]|uniref:carcinine hydrolase/isopenicillin-N N-acyltransferase family protein n=1 Tax=Streptomyces sp. NPDC093586 TaxID=3366042 RepID=UPI0037F439C6